MRLNELKHADGARNSGKRLGRGIGSGLGKTCGKGHKGQKARSGYNKKIGFEGGQMPLQRRVPKFGFVSAKAKNIAEVRLSVLNKITDDRIGLQELKKFDIIGNSIERAKIILSGDIDRAVTLYGKNILVTSGARQAIEKNGGNIEE